MNKLLNRFAWLLSLSSWYIVAFSIIGFDIVFTIFWGAIAWIIIRKLFLSAGFIEDRIFHFSKTLKENENINMSEEKKEDNINYSSLNNIEENNYSKTIDGIKTEEIKDNIIEHSALKTITKVKKYNNTAFDDYLGRIGIFLKDFFSTNIIAKIWSIILFFVVANFLWGYVWTLWDIIWQIWRLIIGFIFSFTIFWFGLYLEKKWNKQESLILIWLSILINYLIILSWRYLIWENISWWDWFLTEGITFLFLILNTIFGILISLIYKSRTLLVFSFLFAYINPFIIWSDWITAPYTLIWYSLIVSLWALFLSKVKSSFSLLFISFVFWNLLFLAAPFTTDIEWSSKIIFTVILSIFSIFLSKKTKDYWKSTVLLFIWTYIFTILHLVNSLNNFSEIFVFSVIGIISFILLFLSYIFSNKKNLEKLFPIWTLGTIVLLSSIIINYTSNVEYKVWNFISYEWEILINDNILKLSIIFIIIFAIANWIMPFINNKLLKKENFHSLISWSLAGVLFIAFQIYSFWELYFPWTIEWLAFAWLAIIYFLQSYLIIKKIGIKKMQEDEDLKNIFYTFAGISISLFSIAVAFVFSDYPEIITTTWLFEATILYYFYSKNNSKKVFTAATILFIVWLTKFWILLDEVRSEDYKFLISFVIILTSFILNLFFINKTKENIVWKNIHSIFHLMWMWIMWGLLLQIIPSNGNWWSMFGISIFLTILWSFYAKFNMKLLKNAFIILIILFTLLHIWEIDRIFWRLYNTDKSYLAILQYIISIIIIFNIFIWNQLNKISIYNKILKIIIALYSFIISNVYVLEFFKESLWHFSLTIYWGLIASFLLFYGIQKNIQKFRTIGLYFLWLTSLKVFLFDIWYWMEWDSRFLVLWILGVIFIIISTLYTKKYWNNIFKELRLDNLKNDNKNNSKQILNKEAVEIKKEEINTKKENIKEEKQLTEENSFMDKLKKIDVSDIKVVRFFPKTWDNFTIRAENIQKLSILITKKFNKTNFEAGELDDIYNYVIKKYKTKLSRREHDKIKTIVKDFIDVGWDIEIVKN
jgi:hypothetical protein